MKWRPLASCLLPIALVLGGLAVGSGAPTAAAPAVVTPPAKVKIMINGDSITQEFTGDYSWRYRLGREFLRQGKPFDFVGKYRAPYPRTPYRVASGWDQDHFAVGAMELADFLPTRAYDIENEIAQYDPDVLVSFLGTNDFTHGLATIDRQDLSLADRTAAIEALPQHIVDLYSTFVDRARAANPHIEIVLGQVMSIKIPKRLRDTYNTLLRDQVVASSTPESPITLALLSDDGRWTSSTYTYDFVHPTPTGEMLIAKRFADALHTLGDPRVLPQVPAISVSYVPWAPALVPKLRVKKRRIYLDASTSMLNGGVLKLKVNLTVLRSGRSTTTLFRPYSRWNSVRLAPGRYRIKIQGLRSTMASKWTKGYFVRVRKR
jgi:lysophospholipase L1-like esterase